MSPVSGAFRTVSPPAVCQTTQWNSCCPQPAHKGAQKLRSSCTNGVLMEAMMSLK